MAMTLGFIGGKNPSQTEAAAALAAECGYTALEFDYWRDFESLTDQDVEAQAAALSRHGIGISAYGLWGYNPIAEDPDQKRHAHAMIERALGYAKRLGAAAMVLSTGDVRGEPLGRRVAIFIETMAPLIERIEAAGIVPTFYALHGNTFLSNLEAYERVWEQMPGLKMKFDPANWLGAGQDNLEVVRRYGNKIGHVHIKEAIFINSRVVSQPPAGMGDMPWGRIMTFLHEHRYDGCLSLEPHMDPWRSGEGLKMNLLLSKRHLNQFML